MPDFGTLLRALRMSAGLSQEELADRSGLSIRAISNLERGRVRWPYRHTLRSLADALELDDAARDEFIGAAERRLVSGTDRAGTAERVDGYEYIPRQLPAGTSPFVGRASELATLDRLLGDDPPSTVVISAIGGTAGVGKTALALYWAHSIARRFPDGQLYANLRGHDQTGMPADAAEIIRGFLQVLLPDGARVPAGLDEQAGMYRSLLAGKRMCVVLDNARSSEQVRPLLPGSGGCLVLVTSRSRLPGLAALDGARLLNLDVLSESEARDLFTLRLGAERTAAEPRAVDELSRFCARLPLALCIVAARAAALPAMTLSDLAAELRDIGGPLNALSSGESSADVRNVFSWSYESLSAGGARLFRLLSLHPGPDIGIPAAASLGGCPAGEARRLLRELTDAGLISERGPARYALHDLLRAYASEQVQLTGIDADAERRLLDYYLHTARSADATLYPAQWDVTFGRPLPGTSPESFTAGEAARAWFDAERQTMLTLVDHAASAGLDDYAWRLSWIIRRHLYAHGYASDLVASQRTALAAARRLGDQEAQGHIHLTLGRAYLQLGDYQEARENLTRALDIYHETDHHVGEAYALLGMGFLFELQHQYDEALGFAQRAVDLSEKFATDPGALDARTTALNNSGWLYACAGRFHEARARSEKALELYREAGNTDGEATALDSLGYIFDHLGEHEEAIACFRESLDLLAGHGNRYTAAETLGHLADAYRTAGDLPAAREALEQALSILDALRHPTADAVRDKLAGLGEPDSPITSVP
jgi:tetratricopeptide (TPR) repeat protein/transcriptional regulator with XRE-family HTH domain